MTTLLTFCTPKYKSVYNKYIGKSIKDLGLKDHKNVEFCFEQPWTTATNLKPLVILDELKEGNNVLYVDCDAVIKDKCVVDIDKTLPENYKAACVFLDWREWYGFESRVVEPLTATMFFRQSAIPLVEEWLNQCKGSKDHDGINFAKLVNTKTPDIFHLGIEWAYIYNKPDGGKGGINCDNPLIVQHQASRGMKSK